MDWLGWKERVWLKSIYHSNTSFARNTRLIIAPRSATFFSQHSRFALLKTRTGSRGNNYEPSLYFGSIRRDTLTKRFFVFLFFLFLSSLISWRLRFSTRLFFSLFFTNRVKCIHKMIKILYFNYRGLFQYWPNLLLFRYSFIRLFFYSNPNSIAHCYSYRVIVMNNPRCVVCAKDIFSMQEGRKENLRFVRARFIGNGDRKCKRKSSLESRRLITWREPLRIDNRAAISVG